MFRWHGFAAILILGAWVSSARAAERVIFTKEVAYCSTGRAVNADRFDIRYYPGNHSIGFDISARSVAANLNADLNIELYAYGKNYINITANLCDILGGALCPLPQYQFDGSFAYILPDSVNIDLPGIAFTVPDLDAYAQVVLINQDTGRQALCLGATLSNGNTVYMDAVRWATIGMTIFAFIVALVHSFWPVSPYKSGPEWRFATILSYFQHIALCGFLSLDYPVVYKNFTLNFVWAQGLIYARPINEAIDRMRYQTGGRNVEGQTFNVIAENNVALFRNLSTVDDSIGNNTKSFAASTARSAAQYAAPEVQAAPSFVLVSGIETSTSAIGITYANAFMTVLIFFLLLCCLMIAICVLAVAGVAVYSAIKHKRTGGHNLRYFLWTNWLRIFLAAYTPLILFIFWQFLHKADSGWLAIFLAALTFVWLNLAILGIYWHLSKIAHRSLNNPDGKVSLRWSTVSSQFKRSGQGFLLLLAGAAFCSAGFVAFAQGRGLVQLIPVIVIQLVVFISFVIWRPFANKWSNVLMIFLELFKLIAYGLLVAFYARLDYNGIIKAVLGFVLIAVQGIMTVILFIVSIYNAGVGLLWGKSGREQAAASHVNAMGEKDPQTGEKLARPFLHPRLTGLEAADRDYPDASYGNVPRSGTSDYATAYPSQPSYATNGLLQNGFGSSGNPVQSGYTPGVHHPPPVSSLYLPAPTSPSQEAQAIHPPFASSPNRESGSFSDRTVVADPLSHTSSSSLGGQKRGLKGLFSRNKA